MLAIITPTCPDIFLPDLQRQVRLGFHAGLQAAQCVTLSPRPIQALVSDGILAQPTMWPYYRTGVSSRWTGSRHRRTDISLCPLS